MRRAYNRSGLGIVALYGIFSIASTVLLGLFAGVGIGIRITQNLNIFELIADSGIFAFSEILRYIYEDPMISIFVMAGMVAGSAAGMLIGIPIMRKILPKENPKPIEDRKLTGPEFLRIILMAFGLWGVGVAIGNLPAFLGYDVANPLLENAGNALIFYPFPGQDEASPEAGADFCGGAAAGLFRRRRSGPALPERGAAGTDDRAQTSRLR